MVRTHTPRYAAAACWLLSRQLWRSSRKPSGLMSQARRRRGRARRPGGRPAAALPAALAGAPAPSTGAPFTAHNVYYVKFRTKGCAWARGISCKRLARVPACHMTYALTAMATYIRCGRIVSPSAAGTRIWMSPQTPQSHKPSVNGRNFYVFIPSPQLTRRSDDARYRPTDRAAGLRRATGVACMDELKAPRQLGAAFHSRLPTKGAYSFATSFSPHPRSTAWPRITPP